MTSPAIITAAICGAETTREQTPHLPIEIADGAPHPLKFLPGQPVERSFVKKKKCNVEAFCI